MDPMGGGSGAGTAVAPTSGGGGGFTPRAGRRAVMGGPRGVAGGGVGGVTGGGVGGVTGGGVGQVRTNTTKTYADTRRDSLFAVDKRLMVIEGLGVKWGPGRGRGEEMSMGLL